MRSPRIRGRHVPWSLLIFVATSLVSLGILAWLLAFRLPASANDRADLRAHISRSDTRVDALSTGLAQEQAHAENQGVKPIVPPAASIAAGKATPPPTDIVPVTPTALPSPPEDGRGIRSTEITAGHLLVTYTDGSNKDVGRVVGKSGGPGRGIVGTSIQAGNLVITYSDHTTQNVGRVVGKRGGDGTDGTDGSDGSDGATGVAGRGVAGSSIVAGHLFVTYTDHTVEDVGQVVGSDGLDGVSITNAVVDATGHLQVTLTDPNDGSTRTIDAGYVMGPPGEDGTDGHDGKDGSPAETETRTYPDGSVEHCTRNAGSPATAPAYSCTVTPSPTPTGSVPTDIPPT